MTTNSNRGEALINIGGAERTVRFRTNQIAQLEEMSGVGIIKLLSQESIGIKTLRDAIFVGLVYSDKKLTPNKVGRWLDDFEGDFADLMSTIFEALAKSIPGVDMEDDEDEEGK